VIGPAMRLLANVVIVLFLTGLIILVNPVIALASATFIFGSYGLVFLGMRKLIAKRGEERLLANGERFQIAQEALGGAKEVKLLGLERAYAARFSDPARRMARAVTTDMVVGESPRYILEGIAFGGMLLLIVVMLISDDGSLERILPLLGVYAFAGLRLFPALQQVFRMASGLRFNYPSLESLHRDLMEVQQNMADRPPGAPPAPMELTRSIELDDVHYAYPQAERAALNGLSLEIPANTTLGIVGGTGAGKTTAVDIILALLMAETGELRVDGVPVTAANRRAWQRSIGYVPQQIFLTDESVRGNIAFGVPAEEIDHAAVERAARIAELHDFVLENLPEGYDTMVGERGVRLSGGQRQRIGIARALYHDPAVLILDEATSALDNLTERAVMDAVHNLGRAKTIIMIAHRLTTVRDCDMIVMLENGRVISSGTYDELLDRSQKFRAMASGDVGA
jgi:ABC-type multidrug transport system fused ATPase/permease subunit